MTSSGDPLARYLEQRSELNEGFVILPTPSPSAVRRTGRQADGESDRRTAEPPNRRMPRSEVDKRGEGDPRWKRDLPPIPRRGIVVSTPSSDLFSEDPFAGTGLDALSQTIRDCTECRLCESRTQAVPGEGPAEARLVVVGEGPGAREDETGRPFVGRAGELLTEILAAIDLPRERVFICNVVKCRPPNNRKPQQDEIDVCAPYLFRQLEIIRPAVILAMGATAAETLLNTRQSLGGLRNRVHEFRGMPLVVTYHPAALLRNPQWKKPTWDDVRIARQLVDRRG